MDDILTEITSPALIRAAKRNLYALFRQFGRSVSAESFENRQIFRWQTPVQHPWFNGVLSLQPPDRDAGQTISDILAYFRTRRVAEFTWWLEPGVPQAGWEEHLSVQGLRYNDQTPGMALILASMQDFRIPPELHIRQVTDLAELKVWTHTFVTGYGIPEIWELDFFNLSKSLGFGVPFQHYLGFWNDQPVAASTLFLGAGVAGLYNVATLPAARGRGIGAAMSGFPLVEARQMGYRVAILQSSEMGIGVYQRLGFVKVCAMDHFYEMTG